MNILSFDIGEIDGGAACVTPMIDGHSLVDLVTAFEIANGYDDPAGTYAGLVPEYYRYGPIDEYFMGWAPISDRGEIEFLQCDCAAPGCWPLAGFVTVSEAEVVWTNFSQPHRPNRNYSNFGPFTFARPQYDRVVGEMALKIAQFLGDEAPPVA